MDRRRASLNNVVLGKAMRTVREANALTPEEVAGRADIPLDEYLQIEAGEMEATWGDLRRIAIGLKTELPQLLALAEKMISEDQ